MDLLLLMLWGVAGGFIYAAQALVLDLWNKGSAREDKTRALALFAVAIFTAGAFAAGVSDMLRAILDHGVQINGIVIRAPIDRVPMALTVGWGSNYLWPKVLRFMGASIDKGPTMRNLP